MKNEEKILFDSGKIKKHYTRIMLIYYGDILMGRNEILGYVDYEPLVGSYICIDEQGDIVNLKSVDIKEYGIVVIGNKFENTNLLKK